MFFNDMISPIEAVVRVMAPILLFLVIGGALAAAVVLIVLAAKKRKKGKEAAQGTEPEASQHKSQEG